MSFSPGYIAISFTWQEGYKIREQVLQGSSPPRLITALPTARDEKYLEYWSDGVVEKNK
jgi:hypothetical protein